MSTLNDLQPYFDSYSENIRRAKNASGYTLQELADLSGVPYTNICDVNSGRTKQPLLFYAAATCKVLGLSLDELVGLDGTGGRETKQKIHELELENAKISGEREALRMENTMLRKGIETRRTLIYSFVGICALLLVAVIAYMIMDMQIKSIGLFQSSGTSALAIVLGIVVLAAVAAVARAIALLIKDSKHPRD